MLRGVLRRAREDLAVVALQIFAEVEAMVNGFVERATDQQRQLDHHGADEVAGLQEIRVDVHVVGDLSASLGILLVSILVRPAPSSLSQEFAHTTRAHPEEALVGLLDQSLSEGSEAEGDQGSVVQDLRGGVHLLDVVLDVGDEEEISGAMVTVMHRVVVHRTQQSSGLRSLITSLEDESAKVAGNHRVNFNAGDFKTGIYFLKIETSDYSVLKRIIHSK